MRKTVFILLGSLLVLAVPQIINYQGKVTNADGTGISGNINMEFRLYTSESGTMPIWQETHNSVPVSNGLFSVLLGSIVPFPDSVDFSAAYWLEVEINDETMSPRERLSSSPYAIRARWVDDALQSVNSVANIARRRGHLTLSADSAFTISDTGDSIVIRFTGASGGSSVTPGLSQVLAVDNSAHGFQINMNANRIVNLGSPIEATDAVTKSYVNGLDGDALSFYSEKFNVNVDGTSLEIASDTLRVKQGGITTEHIADGTITSADIGPGEIHHENIAPAAIDSILIADGSISGADLRPQSITATQIAEGTITGSNIAANTITGANITDSSITSADIAPSTIRGSNLYWPDVTPRLGDSLFYAGGITLSYLAAESINALDAVYLSSWLSGWSYRVPVTITNTGPALAQYQVKITLDSSFPFGHAQSDGRDIRLVDSDGAAPLPFWFQSWNPPSSAVIWVKVGNLQALSSKIIYIYYGNTSATSASSFDNTFTKNFSEGNLVGLWHMDEGGGSSVGDSSGRFNNGTISGATWQGTDGGQWDGASGVNFSTGSHLLFDGVDDYVSVPDATALDIMDAITIEAWVNGSGSVAWLFRRIITLNPATPVNNYQVKVQLNTSNFIYSHAKPDGSDVRFYDLSGNSLSYWIEQWNTSGESIIWVRIPASGTTSFYMQYGNPGATAVSDPSVIRGTQANPGISCTDIRNIRSPLTNGLYYIDPNGGSPGDAYQVYCDMTTNNGGWTLVMKLSKNDFCYGSSRWTDSSPFNESYLLDPTMPNAQQYDAKSRAFYELTDVNSLRFYTSRDTSVTVSFASASSPRTLMTTNTIAFSPYPDYFQWKAAFGHDRSQAPIFMRAGQPVSGGPNCRTNSCPVGCGQPCMFCYQASDGAYCCPCAATMNDVNSGVGNNSAYCGGGDPADCSSAGNWADPALRVIIWARGTITNPVNIIATIGNEEFIGKIVTKGTAYGIGIAGSTLAGFINGNVITTTLPSGWSHIALTYNSTTMKLYLNGTESASKALTGAINTNANNLIIGEKFNGRIDEVRLYDRALSQQEIKCHYERRRYAQSEPTTIVGLEEGSSAVGLHKASATSAYQAEHFLGIALSSGASGDSIPVRISGVAQGFTGLTVGADYYLSDTPGQISINPGSISRRVGTAIAPDRLLISR